MYRSSLLLTHTLYCTAFTFLYVSTGTLIHSSAVTKMAFPTRMYATVSNEPCTKRAPKHCGVGSNLESCGYPLVALYSLGHMKHRNE